MDCTVQDTKDISGALIDLTKHIGCLKFRVWEKMQNVTVTYTPGILDPNTEDVCISLSKDLTTILYRQPRMLLLL
ncbi:E3 ubiquitin-protein ligase TRIM35-like [Xyrauchen texanus]|uniref:E3 ubiquitin-protein ligase TRIM35-like n=1 Tax=Xyrauchen texanus TaxID=154827 RepID=UPI0022422C5C|nr:E3 ubiquitin-protein ligase TRIM35-like [Xyrauchen texanus]